jgi:hypothetical protein
MDVTIASEWNEKNQRRGLRSSDREIS